MADASSIKLPNGDSFAIKDAVARSGLSGKVSISQGSGNSGKILKVNSSGNLALTNETTELPAVTTSDNGKVLRVVSGAWAAASLPNANGVSF